MRGVRGGWGRAKGQATLDELTLVYTYSLKSTGMVHSVHTMGIQGRNPKLWELGRDE